MWRYRELHVVQMLFLRGVRIKREESNECGTQSVPSEIFYCVQKRFICLTLPVIVQSMSIRYIIITCPLSRHPTVATITIV